MAVGATERSKAVLVVRDVIIGIWLSRLNASITLQFDVWRFKWLDGFLGLLDDEG